MRESIDNPDNHSYTSPAGTDVGDYIFKKIRKQERLSLMLMTMARD